MRTQQYPGWESMTGEYQMDPAMQGIIDNQWSQFYQNLPQVYGGVNASLGGAGRTGSGVHARLLGDAGNRAFLGMQGQIGGMKSQDYQGFMGRKSDLMQAKMQEDAALRNAMAQKQAARISGMYGLKSARAAARPGMINAMMGAGNMMDYAMNPFGMGMGYLGQYNDIAAPYQTGYPAQQGPWAGAAQGAFGGGMMGYGMGSRWG
ncbi:MAG: hypothetical protein ACYSW3_25070 [Planctomycetota bacterium]